MVHGCMVYTERAEMAAVSRGTSYVTTKQCCKYTTSVEIQNSIKKKESYYSHSFRITCDKNIVSLLEQRCINAINNSMSTVD